jgi:hypothetical protein
MEIRIHWRRNTEEADVGVHIVISNGRSPFSEEQSRLRNATEPSAIVWVAAVERVCRRCRVLFLISALPVYHCSAELTDVMMEPTILWEVNPRRNRFKTDSWAEIMSTRTRAASVYFILD